MSSKTMITIFQAPFVALIECGAWKLIYCDENEDSRQMDIPAKYYIPVFRSEIDLPDSIPEISDDRTILILEHVFTKFNIDRPKEYCGRSLSVGDVVALEGKKYVCKPIGFQECNFVTSTTDSFPSKPKISLESIKKAEKVLIDNGIEPDEAETVLQAIGYVLLNDELYPENESGKKP